MPSIEESKRQVKAGLESRQTDDHDDILASLQDEIDRHNKRSSNDADDYEHRRGRYHRSRHDDQPRPSLKFRFKSGTSDPRKRKHHTRHDESHRRQKQKQEVHSPFPTEAGAAHPFPREPTNPDQARQADSTAAFRESLFDALADDEGAAYWESVYSQPIHVYPRPTVETAKGELEQMNDDDYAAYVQTKMWERKHPHIVLERERREKQRKQEEEERTREREEFVRRKERAAWERAQRRGARKHVESDDEDKEDGSGGGGSETHQYGFDHDDVPSGSSSRRSADLQRQQDYRRAWEAYLAAWDQLKNDLSDRQPHEDLSAEDGRLPRKISQQIPWPVLQPKPVTRPNIEAFMSHMPFHHEGKTRVQLLKAERVRWHPDKVQQRFAGRVDEGTMKIVTSVFHVVDDLLEMERKR